MVRNAASMRAYGKHASTTSAMAPIAGDCGGLGCTDKKLALLSAASTVSPPPLVILILRLSVLGVAAEGADQRLQFLDRRADPLPVGAADDQGDAEIAAPEIRVGADFEIGVARLQFPEILGDRPFRERAADAAGWDRRTALESVR